MTLQQQGTIYATPVSAGGYSPYGEGGTSTIDFYGASPTLQSTADLVPLFGVFTTSEPSVLALIRLKSPIGSAATYNYAIPAPIDALMSIPTAQAYAVVPASPVEIGPPPRPLWVELPNLPVDIYTGNGIIIPISVVSSLSASVQPDVVITFNFIKSPPVIEEIPQNRQTIKLVEDQASGIEANSSKEYTLELTRYEQEGLTIDNPVPNLRRRTGNTILANNRSKDRRNVISSIVNNYSRVTKRS